MYAAHLHGCVEVRTAGVQKLGRWQCVHRTIVHWHEGRSNSYTYCTIRYENSEDVYAEYVRCTGSAAI